MRLLPILIAAALLALPAAAQSNDPLFDDGVVHEVRLRMHPADWQRLRDNFLENTYYPAEFTWQGRVVSDIGVRSRGFGSRSAEKPGLKVDFNRYVSTQEFLGLKSIVLDNNIQDASWVRERLSMKLFRRMGFAAPREAFARLLINNEFVGLYSIVEEVDKAFLRRNLGEDSGFLYEFKWLGEYRFEDLGEDLALYFDIFSPRTNENTPELEVIGRMIQAFHETPDDQFAADVGRYIDLARFMRYLAVENYLSEWDGVLGYAGMNNLYLYRSKGSEQFRFMAWDKDVTLQLVDHPVLYNIDTNILARRAFAIPELRHAYFSALTEASTMAGGEDGWLRQELEIAYNQIVNIVPQDRRWPGSVADFQADIALVREVVNGRAAFIQGELETIGGSSE